AVRVAEECSAAACSDCESNRNGCEVAVSRSLLSKLIPLSRRGKMWKRHSIGRTWPTPGRTPQQHSFCKSVFMWNLHMQFLFHGADRWRLDCLHRQGFDN